MTMLPPEDDPDDVDPPDKVVSERWRLQSQRARDNDRAQRQQNIVAMQTGNIAIPPPTAQQINNALGALLPALGNLGAVSVGCAQAGSGPIYISLSVGQATALAAKLAAGPLGNILK